MRQTFVLCTLIILTGGYSLVAAPAPQEVLKDRSITGGLIVHVGCDNTKLIADLAASGSFVVQGLSTDPAVVDKMRGNIRSAGFGGTVSADIFNGEHLPYVDNLVNLIIAEKPGKPAMSEIMRALCPGGVAYFKDGKNWSRKIKPRPDNIDEWTHYLHGPDNNAVAKDSVVGPPRRFQWISEPKFSRSHDHLATVTSMVSAGGRVFFIVDMGSTAFVASKARWRLVARDAFNGVKLWEREIEEWEGHLRDFRSGPVDVARRLVAIGNRVYVTLGYGRPVSALDAATGDAVRTYKGTDGTREILYYDNMLLLVLGQVDKDWPAEQAREIVSQKHYSPPFDKYTPPAHNMQLMAVDPETGKVLWRNTESYTKDMMPSTLAADEGRICFQNLDAVVCLDASTGELNWRTARSTQRRRLAWSTPTVVVQGDIVFAADRRPEITDGELLWMPSGGYHDYIKGDGIQGELVALNARTGEKMWSCPAYEGFNAPVDIMLADGLLWTGRYAWGNDPGITKGRDPRTGEVRWTRPADQEVLPRFGHARCHRAKATTEYLILGRRGLEFVDLDDGDMIANFWVRGICQYGVMPANGLIYIPPHSCACNVQDMIKSGFLALASASRTDPPDLDDGERLVKGPAADFEPESTKEDKNAAWPTYRGNCSRSASTAVGVPAKVAVDWETKIGGKLSSPVIAEGLLFVAGTDDHRIYALDAEKGEQIWSFTAGSRIDSPPTVDRGRVLFGSADGRVYCLRSKDGALIWKFAAAPLDRRIIANGQLESPWPVSGSVLVIDDAVYFVAGRNSYLDGGMRLHKLDVSTGKVLKTIKLEVDKKRRDGGFASGGYLPDVLSTDGKSIFMRSNRFDLDLNQQKPNVDHLWSSVGFLDDSWWHRTYWQIGSSMSSGWGGWPKAGQKVPAGRLLVTGGGRVFGFGRSQYDIPGAHVGIDADGVWGPIRNGQSRWTFYRLFSQTPGNKNKTDWTRRLPLLVRAMVLAGPTLFVAGPSVETREVAKKPAQVDPLAEALESDRGGRLMAISSADGERLNEYYMKSPPIFDGMAAAYGHLYLCTRDGGVICMGGSR